MKEGIMKMKKIKLLLLLLGVFILSGCNITKDSMEDIEIYTTIYPIKYLITSLYGDHAEVNSIYPAGVDTNEFKLSDKKLKEYSNTDLFVFNSLDRERDFAVKMINYNKNLKVIDVSMGMNYDNNIAELWLNPYNYLMMAQNTKNGLLEYISNPYLISNDEGTGIENKYEELKYNISRLDADMKEAISLAPYKTVVVDSNLFKYLEKYSLNVISLEEDDKLNENKKLYERLIELEKYKNNYFVNLSHELRTPLNVILSISIFQPIQQLSSHFPPIHLNSSKYLGYIFLIFFTIVYFL